MEQSPSQRTTPLKIFSILVTLAICGCSLFVLYLFGLYLIVDRDISLIPTPTLDLACEDATCLKACIRRIPDFDIPRLGEYRDELSQDPMGYEIARYRLEKDGTLKRVAVPKVPDYLKPYQENIQLHQRIWDYFTGIYPNNQVIRPSYMVIYMNNEAEHVAASVADLDGKWSLSVNLIDLASTEAVFRILTHEYGHMLTINHTQIRDSKVPFNWRMNRKEFDKMLDSCEGSFFTGRQCANASSYLHEFGNRFWMGEVYESWIDMFLPPSEVHLKRAEMTAFYTKYADQFVTPYAATNSVEDIAESWTGFVLWPKPSGQSVADQKILYFYEHSELVELRAAILHNICQYAQDQK